MQICKEIGLLRCNLSSVENQKTLKRLAVDLKFQKEVRKVSIKG